MIILLILGSILIGGLHFTVHPHLDMSWFSIYKDFAHVWVGFLLGMLFTRWRAVAGSALVVLTVLEIILSLPAAIGHF